jgi:hypothetical protein
MLLIYREEDQWTRAPLAERVTAYEEAVAFSEELRQRGVYQGGEPLELSSTATTVRMKNSKVVMTDGPFAETKEQLGGYSIVEASNLDEVLAIVRRHPLVKAGLSIEVRPIRNGPPR